MTARGRRPALALCAATAFLLATCRTLRPIVGPIVPHPPAYPPTVFAVLSDLHVYDRSLGITGQAFQDYLGNERKLLVESEEILDTALRVVDQTDARFVLVSGDLTKDGEASSHLIVADYLAAMERTGRQVWVVPGNHDLDNPDALRYLDDRTEPVDRVSRELFARIYADFGYNQALDRDPVSLSYLAEPVPGLWLLAVDSTDPERNLESGRPEVDGSLEPDTLVWIAGVLEKAAAAGNPVIAMLHHNVVPHFASEEKYLGEYLLDDWARVARLLAGAGVRLVFTGHGHAQDVAVKRWEDGTFLFDAETGSLVTWPNPLRMVRVLPDGTVSLRTHTVDQIPSLAEQGISFERHAYALTHEGIQAAAVGVMESLGVKRAEADTLSGQIADAVVAHYAGDERFEGQDTLELRGLSLMGRLIVGARKRLIYDMWNDPEPYDRDIDIRISGGTWAAADTEP